MKKNVERFLLLCYPILAATAMPGLYAIMDQQILEENSLYSSWGFYGIIGFYVLSIILFKVFLDHLHEYRKIFVMVGLCVALLIVAYAVMPSISVSLFGPFARIFFSKYDIALHTSFTVLSLYIVLLIMSK